MTSSQSDVVKPQVAAGRRQPAAIGLTAAYPFVLALTGFYLPQERARIGAFGRRFMLGRV